MMREIRTCGLTRGEEVVPLCGIAYSPTLPPPALLGDSGFSGDKGIYQQESAILKAAALLVICPGEYHATTNFLEGDFWTGIPSECPFTQALTAF